jgi:CAAX protease family protein
VSRQAPSVGIRLRKTFAHLDPLIPRRAADRTGFRAVAVSAGFCEEVFYRGFLVWYVAAFAGLLPAVAHGSAAFGVDHLYLGRTYVLRTFAGGLVFAAIVLLAGSLWPAMITHATADLVSGDLGERVLSQAE